MLIDLHTHTSRHSWDATLSPEELIDQARSAGLDGVCLTEHDFFWDPDEARLLERRHGFLVLPAVEINTDDGHFLCYGLDRYIFGMHHSYELALHVRRAGGAIVAAHPYRRQMPPPGADALTALKALIRATHNPAYKYCAGIETLNGRGSMLENEFAQRVARRYGLPGTGASDAHQPDDVGRAATEFAREITSLEGLIEELNAGRFRAVNLRVPG